MNEPSMPAISRRPGLVFRLRAVEKTALRQLFSRFTEIHVEDELKGGYVARVLLVTPLRNGEEQAAQVVKMGDHARMADEAQRFREYVRDTLPFLAPQMIDFAHHGKVGAITYPYLRDNVLGETALLKDFYLAHTAAEILTLLEKLLMNGLGESFYRHRHPGKKILYYQDCYGRYFPPDLTMSATEITTTVLAGLDGYPRFAGDELAPTLAGIVLANQQVQLDDYLVERQENTKLTIRHREEPFRVRINLTAVQAAQLSLSPGQSIWLRGQITNHRHQVLTEIVHAIFVGTDEADVVLADDYVKIAGKPYPNPLAVYQNRLQQKMPRNLSLTHGDLHLFNVIVDSFHKPWLIDFGRTGEGHALFDFVELETHLRHAILGQSDFSAADWVEFERRPVCALTAEQPMAPPAQPNLAKAFVVIQGIRQLARRYARQPDKFNDEYLPALFLYSLATLKFHQSNGRRSAQRAFLTAVVVAAFLEKQLDCHRSQPLLAITDPVLEYHVFYLRRAAGDDLAAEEKRRAVFRTELQRTADTLRQWLGQPTTPIVWENNQPENRRMMVRQYYSGTWQDGDGRYHIWLMAYAVNDSYLLRVAVSHPGAEQPPQAMDKLRQAFTWQPATEMPEYLGQQRYAICPGLGAADKLAQIILDTPAVRHTSLNGGELYAAPAPDSPYLLIYENVIQEKWVGSFFDEYASQLGWYQCKVLRQERLYEQYLYPTANAARQQLSAIWARANEWLQATQPDEADTAVLSGLRRELERAIMAADALMTTAQNVLDTVTTNVNNYADLTEAGAFFPETAVNDLFPAQNKRLRRASRQIEADIARWQNKLAQARRTLDIIDKRLPSPTHVPAVTPEASGVRQPEDFLFLEADVTIMFEDIADSTGYIRRHGDPQWQKLVQQHDTTLHKIIGHYKGRVMNQLGDGSLSIFSDAAQAVRAALAIAAALGERNRNAGPAWQLPVRIGLHSGKALVGRNMVLGLAVNLASRVCDTAVAGEIVISEATYEMGRGEAAVFQPFGSQKLKGFTNPITLYRWAAFTMTGV